MGYPSTIGACFMTRRLRKSVLLIIVALLLFPFVAHAQAGDWQGRRGYAPRQIEQIVAPVALYPDALLTQLLVATTHPADVVEAERWLQNPQIQPLQGEYLLDALEQQPWDASVKALASVPPILAMLDNNLRWTQKLGRIFTNRPEAVMASVQRLRQMAQHSGYLVSNAQQTVFNQDGVIIIMPANPEVLYIPYYNPVTVYRYGANPYHGAYPNSPYAMIAPPQEALAVRIGNNASANAPNGFIHGINLIASLWEANHWDWQHHQLRREAVQDHNPEHHPVNQEAHPVYYPQQIHPGNTPAGTPATPSPYPPRDENRPREENGRGSRGALQSAPPLAPVATPASAAVSAPGNNTHPMPPQHVMPIPVTAGVAQPSPTHASSQTIPHSENTPPQAPHMYPVAPPPAAPPLPNPAPPQHQPAAAATQPSPVKPIAQPLPHHENPQPESAQARPRMAHPPASPPPVDPHGQPDAASKEQKPTP